VWRSTWRPSDGPRSPTSPLLLRSPSLALPLSLSLTRSLSLSQHRRRQGRIGRCAICVFAVVCLWPANSLYMYVHCHLCLLHMFTTYVHTSMHHILKVGYSPRHGWSQLCVSIGGDRATHAHAPPRFIYQGDETCYYCQNRRVSPEHVQARLMLCGRADMGTARGAFLAFVFAFWFQGKLGKEVTHNLKAQKATNNMDSANAYAVMNILSVWLPMTCSPSRVERLALLLLRALSRAARATYLPCRA
jgi:hypothetical protein